MTPIIDIVFLLIIFFLVVCQFIEAENFPVTVPDGCDFAQGTTDPQTGLTTVTVMKTDNGAAFAVGSEKITASSHIELVERIIGLIDARLQNLPDQYRIVTLRVDKDIYFTDAQYALAAIAASTATDVKLAMLKHERPESK